MIRLATATSYPRVLVLALAGFVIAGVPLRAQATAGSISGVVQDAQGAVVPSAKVTLTNENQGAGSARTVNTTGDGTFVFTPVLAGKYTVTVEMTGFKKYAQSGITLDVNDKLGLPTIALQVGATGESVTVEAAAVQLQTLSAERSGVVTGAQVVDIAINGRNYTSLLKTVPGIAADAGTGDVSSNGGRTAQNNFTLDGQNVTDIGVNQQFAYRISMDAIQEFKVSTNGQTAEYGRNDGAQVQVVTKSGTKDFHGDGYWFKRGEFMNANSFTNNLSGIQRPIYRFMDAGWTLGGPIYIPGVLNKNKDKLFGFMSQEWNRNITPGSLHQITVPTAAERTGDFSLTHDATGAIQKIIDPATRSASNPSGTQFVGNLVPANRFSQYGPSTLNWLPLPNTPGQASYNYQSQIASSSPSYDQIYRVDYNLSEKWRFFVRALDNKQTQNVPYGRADTSNNLGLTPFYAPTYGWSLTANVATIISPTLFNEFQFGYTVNGIPGDGPVAGSPYYRSVSNINIPLLYPAANISGVIPNFNFSGVPFGASTINGSQMTSFAGTPYNNRNPVWNYIDNITKVTGRHTIKGGIYYEYAIKTENAFKPYNATIDFGRDANNPGDSNWAFSNALLGNYLSYTQINKDPLPSYPYKNLEFYGQDTWKITSKLTLNYGLRIAFIKPFHDTLGLMSNFDPSKYDPAQRVVFYQQSGTGASKKARNPITGELLPAVLIGAIVPGVGNINNGLVQSGQNGTPEGLMEDRGAHWGPRIGLAYQIDSKTVFRMGGGVFYERVATFGIGITSNYTTNPPNLRTAQLYYGNVADISSSPGTFFPTAISKLSSDGHVPTVYNYNAGIQRELPWKLFAEVSYVGTQSRHLWLAQPFNLAPLGSAWQPYTQDPNVTPTFDGNTNLPVNMYRPYAGYTNAIDYTWGTNNNYNALQTSLNKRVGGGLQMGVAYTWSKALGVSVGHINDTRTAGYGPLPQDRTQSLVVNYIYDIPGIHKGSFLDNAASRLVLNGWQLSGLTSVSSGAPTNITSTGTALGYAVSGVAQTTLNRTITGSEDVVPRVVFTCNPNVSGSIDAFVNTSCFAPAQKGSVGLDSGYDRLRGPGLQNWDMSLFKNISIKEGRAHIQLRLEAYNAFNHTEWGSFNTSILFNAAGKIGNLPTQLGGTGGRLGFGALNSVRLNSQRILQVGAKVYF
ncbi:MAG: carboxypeptidase regulatory-like domain-containing protein [Acidobacteriia bacterium]|nr:carboxypeptidase regulatory-like domain-containing protein [Terriglobia bacterium]